VTSELVSVLRRVSAAASAISPLLPGAAGVVAAIVGESLALAADLAAAGEEPVAAIMRIRDTTPVLALIERQWQDRLRARFGALTAIRSNSIAHDDIYAALEAEADR